MSGIPHADGLGDWARRAFGLGAGPVSLGLVGRGAEARIHLLEVDGARYALKTPFGAFDEDDVLREAAYLEHFAAAGIEVPLHCPDRSGRYVVPVPEALGGGVVRLTRWVEGVPVGLPTADLAGPVGALLGTLHAAAPPAGPDTGKWHTTSPDDSVWEDLVRRSAGMPWGTALRERTDDLRSHGALVRAVGPPSGRLVVGHRDLHPDNVVRAPDGSLRALDWEDAGPVDPTRELAKVLVQWHVEGPTVDALAVQATVAAYRAAGGPGLLRGPEAFAMVLSSEQNFLAAQVRKALDPSVRGEHLDHALGEIAESLAYLPTTEALSQVLAAAAGA